MVLKMVLNEVLPVPELSGIGARRHPARVGPVDVHHEEVNMHPTLHYLEVKPGAMVKATAIGGLLLLAACASAPLPPTAALQAAETAIASAEQARVADYASPELSEARIKLNQARTAVSQEKMLMAEHLAEQACVDAELALAKTQHVKARMVNDEMLKSTEAMKQEMQRNTGAKL